MAVSRWFGASLLLVRWLSRKLTRRNQTGVHGMVTDMAAERKAEKHSILPSEYIFQPIAVEYDRKIYLNHV